MKMKDKVAQALTIHSAMTLASRKIEAINKAAAAQAEKGDGGEPIIAAIELLSSKKGILLSLRWMVDRPI